MSQFPTNAPGPARQPTQAAINLPWQGKADAPQREYDHNQAQIDKLNYWKTNDN